MKNIFIKIAAVALLIGATACQKKLDAVESGDSNGNSNGGGNSHNYSAVYVKKDIATIAFAGFDDQGDGQIEISLTNLPKNDVSVTLSAVDFLAAYNEANNTTYKMLPVRDFVLYEKGNENNRSTNGTLHFSIKEGKAVAQIGIKVNSLSRYSMKTKYAIPLRIVSSSLPTLTNKSAIVIFERPLKTSAIKIKQRYAFGVKLDDAVQRSEEYTLQGQFMFSEFHPYEDDAVNMSLFQGPLPYTRVNKETIQVKDGGGDEPENFAKVDIGVGKWNQITFVYKNDLLKLYVNGELIKTYQRPGYKIEPGMQINVENAQTSYNGERLFREFRVWNRALSEAEIKGDLYLPVDPNSKGLVAYVSFEKGDGLKDLTKYNNTIVFRKGKSDSNIGRQDGDSFVLEVDENTFKEGIEWIENIKFPAKTLEFWN